MKKLFSFVWVAVAALLLQCSAPASRSIATGSPAAAGTAFQSVDSLLQAYVSQQWLAGGVAIVVKNGQVLYHKGIGYDDIEKRTPLQKDAIFRIASQTKAVTSVGIMMLVEEGRLRLTDPVSTYIPEFKNPRVIDQFRAADTTYTTVPARREITIHDLLTHTSGIGYAQIGSAQMNALYYKAGIVGGIGVDKGPVLADNIRRLGTLPLFHQPGERWTYGLNTDVLGYVIEVVSGTSLADFFRRRIFEPLGMQDTYFYLPANKRHRLATIYTQTGEKKAVKMPALYQLNGTMHSDYPAMDGTYFSGGAGLSSTAQDYAAFMQLLLGEGSYRGRRLLKPETVRLMTSNQIGDLRMRNNHAFGLGFEILTGNSTAGSPLSAGSYYWGGMFSSTYWIDPKEGLVAQLFLQQYPNSHGAVHDQFKAAVYRAIRLR